MRKISMGRVGAVVVLTVLIFANVAFLPKVFATTYLTKSTLLFTNMVTGGAGSLVLAFTPGAADTTPITLTLTGWTGSAGTGTIATGGSIATSNTIGTANCTTFTGASANFPTGTAITAADTVATGTIVINGITALTAGTAYCMVLPAIISANPTGAGQGSATIATSSDATQTVTYDIISGDTVVVNATVPQSFTLAIAGTPDNFPTLSTASVTGTTGATATIVTNSASGWYLEGEDAWQGLKSINATHTIAEPSQDSNTTIVHTAEGYVTAATITGSGSITVPFTTSGSGNGAGLSDSTLDEIADGTADTASSVVTVKEYASIIGTTPAATDYTDTITLVGAGAF